MSIKNSMGDWITEIEEVKDVFQKGFVNLYQTEQCCCKWECPTLDVLGSRLSEEDAVRIASPPLDMEILKALNTMKPFKAPGVDGLHAGFFQCFWMSMGESVKEEVKGIFSSCYMPPYLNQTLVVLIPKRNGPESIGHYRPISLCNTVYKIVTKILVLRLKIVIVSLFSPIQIACIGGRRGTNNVIIAQELVYSLNQKKGK